MILIVILIIAALVTIITVTYKIAYRQAKIATLNYLFMKDFINPDQYSIATKTDEI